MRITLDFSWRAGLTLLALVASFPFQAGAATGHAGNVYVMTNNPSNNAVMVFGRDAAGRLDYVGSFATGGAGAGTGADPLASQGALVLSQDQRLLLTVNAGSNTISILAAQGDNLKLLNTVPSGGVMPVSVAVRQDLVYAVNAGGTPNISGFTIDAETNRLIPLAGSIRDLPGGAAAGPAQVSFSPDGNVLVVTEKGTNRVDTFPLKDKLPGPGVSSPFSGLTPFGFAFAHDVLVISDAGGGPGTSSVSSYGIESDGTLAVISPALANGQTAACWLVIPANGRFAYSANAGSATISSYSVAPDGNLALLNQAAGSTATGSAPTDMAVPENSQFLFTRNGGSGTISSFRIEADGSLTPMGATGGVPAGSQGIAAR